MSPQKLLLSIGIVCVVLLLLCISLIYKFTFSSPINFPQDLTVIIEPGQSVTSISNELGEKHIIRSKIVLRSLIILFGGERDVAAGLYVFHTPQNAFKVAQRIVRGEFGYVPVKITIPEGTNVFKIAEYVHEKFPNIDEEQFLNKIRSKEGYLFPNTYFFPPQATADMIIEMMSSQFEREIEPLQDQINSSGHSLQDIIIMASILEGEVQTVEDRKMVADLLWRRIENGIPMQVDSTFTYINGKTSAQLTLKDLKIDSPYNSYVYKGLPPTPISNPGIETIEAALNPTPNDYVYFLSDKDGITHFARTHDEHIKLKNQYLR